MEKDEKIQLLLGMQEHPEQFSEQALKTMLDDPEIRELMEATAQLKQAMINEENMEDNVDAEWQRFEQATLTFGRTCSRSEKQMQTSLSSRLVASFIGILMMSGIAFAAIHLWSHTPTPLRRVRGVKTTSCQTLSTSHLPSRWRGRRRLLLYVMMRPH